MAPPVGHPSCQGWNNLEREPRPRSWAQDRATVRITTRKTADVVGLASASVCVIKPRVKADSVTPASREGFSRPPAFFRRTRLKCRQNSALPDVGLDGGPHWRPGKAAPARDLNSVSA